MTFTLKRGERINQRQLIADLVALQYKRTAGDFSRGTFRVRGDTLDIFPAHYEDRAWRVNLFGDEVESIEEFDPLTGRKSDELEFVKVYANSHYVTPRPTLIQAMASIKEELRWRLDQLNAAGRLLEAQRLEQRTLFDLEMMEATGSCAGIENYSRYLTGRKPGEPPPTLFEYVPDNALVFVDESHVTIPQIGGMYRGDFRRKATLAEYGFRLPSCMDNRPLRFEEWDAMRPQTVAVSATPGGWEINESGGVFAEQVIRPTGLIDPPVDVRPARTQVDDLVGEIRQVALRGLSRARHRADQAHGRGPHRISARAGHPRALHALRHRHAGAHRDHPRPAARRVRRAGRHQPAARGPRHSGMRAGRDPRRRQGRLPAQRDLADPDHRPRRAQHRRQRHPLCRHDHRLDAARDGGDRAAGARSRRPTTPRNGITPEIDQEVDRRHHGLERLRARPRADLDRRRPRPASATRTPPPSGTISRRCSPTSRSACARPPPTSNFEEAARLRDEVKRLRATELAVVDDPTAKRSSPSAAGRSRATGGQGWRSRAALTAAQARPRRDGHRALPRAPGRIGPGQRTRAPRKPKLDEMGPGTESAPYRDRGEARLVPRARPSDGPACAAGGRRRGGDWRQNTPRP